jgi:trk system potassium uptake protein TrkH
LVILGGLGFSVLHNLIDYFWHKITLLFALKKRGRSVIPPEKIQLQTKIVLIMNLILIIAGTTFLLIIQNNTGKKHIDLTDAFFQAVIARTAGYNSIDISILSDPARLLMIILMLIGGSPASAAGGIKTVTFAVIIVAIYSAIRKRSEVEIFKRSIPLQIVGKALSVTMLFTFVFLTMGLLLSITERHSGFDFSAIMFETASALGTVGLSCGITPSLTTAGKIIIIITMLVGRLGPLTLLTLLTFNIRPARVNYPMQPVVVG